MTANVQKIATELTLATWQIEAVATLLSEDATVPFIARYRKEATGSLDEVQVSTIRDRLKELQDLDNRREAILKSLQERELLTDQLQEKILTAENMARLEDLYLPYKPKKRTRAAIAKEKGLALLAEKIFEQDPNIKPLILAEEFLIGENAPANVQEALAGAKDIIAEIVNEHDIAREKLRVLFENKGSIKSRLITEQDEKAIKYQDYFEWEELIKNIPSHRLLALRRGETEGVLSLTIRPPEEEAIMILENIFIKNDSESALLVKEAIIDSYKRLLSASMETELRVSSKKRADGSAIEIFSQNLNELLLAPPLGNKKILAIDPGFRTGCKMVALSEDGALLEHATIQPHTSDKAREEATLTVLKFINKYQPQVIAIGNGTAGRETEVFVKSIKDLPYPLTVVLVNESGASIYSASEVAREEFPDLDLTIRGAISIGRRLLDPLAELVKIDPKSIGVGQYQHDVNQTDLKNGLDDVVISCVNKVGVEANTASEQILNYVSGLGPSLAKNIIKFRRENGPFKSRKDFLKVPRLGPKAFEQCAGFLRIRESINPLDRSAVHPESYQVVESMASDLNSSIEELMNSAELRKKIKPEKYINDTIGLPTLKDILSELEKPGRDPRAAFKAFSFAESLEKIEDLKPGMKIPGIVTNVTAFGAFIDVGVHQDGLVHISEIADHYVKDPHSVLKVNQEVMVTVLEVDLKRKRIALSLKLNQLSVTANKQNNTKKEFGNKNTAAKVVNTKNKNEKQLFNNPFASLKK